MLSGRRSAVRQLRRRAGPKVAACNKMLRLSGRAKRQLAEVSERTASASYAAWQSAEEVRGVDARAGGSKVERLGSPGPQTQAATEVRAQLAAAPGGAAAALALPLGRRGSRGAGGPFGPGAGACGAVTGLKGTGGAGAPTGAVAAMAAWRWMR